MTSIEDSWAALPAGGRSALTAQWVGLAHRALPCGAAITDPSGDVIAAGRNAAYDQRSGANPLERSRVAHAELNAIAVVDTDIDHSGLVLWATQHPCAMCAAAVAFTGIGRVVFLSDDPTDWSSAAERADTRGAVPYEALDAPEWEAVTSVLFLYTGAVLRGAGDGNIGLSRRTGDAKADLVLELAASDSLGRAANDGRTLTDAIAPHWDRLSALSGDLHRLA